MAILPSRYFVSAVGRSATHITTEGTNRSGVDVIVSTDKGASITLRINRDAATKTDLWRVIDNHAADLSPESAILAQGKLDNVPNQKAQEPQPQDAAATMLD